MDGSTLATSTRDRLRAAIATRAAAADRLGEATAVLERAQAAINAAGRRLDAFAGADAAIAEHRAAEIKRGSIAGALPADLAATREAKRQAEEEAADAKRAHDLLARERSTVAAEAKRAENAVIAAAAAVIVDEITTAAAELAELQAKAFRLKIALRGAIGIRIPAETGAPRLLGLPAEAVNAISSGGERWETVVQGLNGPEARATAQWTDYLRRLQHDADARLEA